MMSEILAYSRAARVRSWGLPGPIPAMINFMVKKSLLSGLGLIIAQAKEAVIMIVLISFIGVSVFLFGLYQWAQSGASLWQIFTLRKLEKDLPAAERAQAEREVKELERRADRRISASLRIIAGLAVFVWLFLGLQMVLELFGVNMIGSLSSHARQYWSQPSVSTNSPVQMRNDMLRNMGNNLRR